MSSQTHQLRLTISNVHASIDTIIIASVFHGGRFFAFFAVNQHPRKFNPQIRESVDSLCRDGAVRP